MDLAIEGTTTMENTTPGALKNSLTSTPCIKRKSLFNPPDISPISRGSSRKRNRATTIVSKIPVKVSSRNLLEKIPRLSGQTKTSDPEKPVLRAISNNEQTDESAKKKGKKGNKSPKSPRAADSNKEASLNKTASSSTSNKKDKADNTSKTLWEKMEVLSHEVLSPVTKQRSNLDIDLDDDDDGDFESTKKGKKNVLKSKKCPGPKKSKQDKKSAKSACGKKKAAAEETEEVVENIPEETKINSKMQLDVEGANKVVESRRVARKVTNKEQKKPTRNKRKTAGCDLDPVAEESVDVEAAETRPIARAKRMKANQEGKDGVSNPVVEPSEKAAVDVDSDAVEDCDSKSPSKQKPAQKTKKKKNAHHNVKEVSMTFSEIGEKVNEDDEIPLGKIVDCESELPSKQKPAPKMKKKKTAQENVKEVLMFCEMGEKGNENDGIPDPEIDCKSKSPSKQKPAPKMRKKKTAQENVKEVSMAFSEVGEKGNENDEIPEPEIAETIPTARAKRMKANQEGKDVVSKPVVEPKENAVDEDADAVEDCDSKSPSKEKPAPKMKKKKTAQENVREESMSFSEMAEKGNKNDEIPDLEIETAVETKLGKRKAAAAVLGISSNPLATTSEATDSKSTEKNVSVETKRSRRKVPPAEQEPTPIITITEASNSTSVEGPKLAETSLGTRRRKMSTTFHKSPSSSTSKDLDKSKNGKKSDETPSQEDKPSQQRGIESPKKAAFCKPSTSKTRFNKVDDAQPSTSSMFPAKKIDVKLDSSMTPSAAGSSREFPTSRIFGNSLPLDFGESAPVGVFKSLKPSDNVMGGFITISPSSSHNGYSTNYNLYCLMTDTRLKVTIAGLERRIEKQTSFLVPKDCQFAIENLGSERAFLSFTKFRTL